MKSSDALPYFLLPPTAAKRLCWWVNKCSQDKGRCGRGRHRDIAVLYPEPGACSALPVSLTLPRKSSRG